MTGQKSEYKNEEKVPKGEIPVYKLKKIEKAKKDELKWIWFGHSSSLLQIEGKNVLMDPVFQTIVRQFLLLDQSVFLSYR